MTSLFVVYDTKRKKVIKDGFGKDQKSEAKKLRDSLNSESKSTTRYVVHKGCDHMNFKSIA